MMADDDSEICADRKPTPVIAFPIALYESTGLLFELYDGGQPHRTSPIKRSSRNLNVESRRGLGRVLDAVGCDRANIFGRFLSTVRCGRHWRTFMAFPVSPCGPTGSIANLNLIRR